jgi:hypothetical protein
VRAPSPFDLVGELELEASVEARVEAVASQGEHASVALAIGRAEGLLVADFSAKLPRRLG